MIRTHGIEAWTILQEVVRKLITSEKIFMKTKPTEDTIYINSGYSFYYTVWNVHNQSALKEKKKIHTYSNNFVTCFIWW